MKPSTSPRCSPVGLSTSSPRSRRVRHSDRQRRRTSAMEAVGPQAPPVSRGMRADVVEQESSPRSMIGRWINPLCPPDASPVASPRERADIADRFKWNLQQHLFRLGRVAGRLRRARAEDRRASPRSRARSSRGAEALLRALRLRDEIGQLEYKVWYFASLWYDQDQRDNQMNARRQQVQILFAKAAQACAWFDPELLHDSAAHRPGVDGREPRARRLPLRDRGSLPAAGARARRQGRAPAVALEPLLVGAERRLCGALDRRRQASDAARCRTAPRSR